MPGSRTNDKDRLLKVYSRDAYCTLRRERRHTLNKTYFFLPFVVSSMLAFMTDNILFSYILMFSLLVRLFAMF